MKPVVFNQNAAVMNTYLVIHQGKCVIIDPGFNGEDVIAYLALHNLTLSFVLITHGHYDHIRDLRLLAKTFAFPLYIHEADQPMLMDDRMNGATYFNGSFRIKADQVVHIIKDGEAIPFGLDAFKVWHTPGHTAGCVCFEYLNYLFTGDTLFHGDLGRTDLVSGSQKMLDKSIIKLFQSVSNDRIVYPGHEESSTMGLERKENPYVLRLLKS
jgi:glyoxylase-like metal-dependent hydrolase (beta-lactamase superfamily II)